MPKHLLLIEDEPNIIEAISFILSRDGWSVRAHSDGTNAVETASRLKPDVIILDVMLPGKSGYDILREIREEPDIAGIPVLMLTARGQSRDRDMAERAGASRFMTKPFSNAEVLDAVRDLVAEAPGP